ncbi:MAG TPA: hypothetical protein VFT62_06700 [Mycobacteriales bacterium]|nr:hypothetical protein [Mycobacteriales bacterium]
MTTTTSVNWPRTFGWFATGVGATLTASFVAGAIGQLFGVGFGTLFQPLAVIGTIALVLGSRPLPRRYRIALAAGAATPVVVAAAIIGAFLISLATDPNAFTF